MVMDAVEQLFRHVGEWFAGHRSVSRVTQWSAGVALLISFPLMFLSHWYRPLEPFVRWECTIAVGAYLISFLGYFVILFIIDPVISLADELISWVTPQKCSKLEKKLTAVWCWITAALLGLVIATFWGLEAYGLIANVKVWFVSLCATAIFLPWYMIGILWRKAIRVIETWLDPGAPIFPEPPRTSSEVTANIAGLAINA